MTTANLEAIALQFSARKAPFTRMELQASFRDGGMVGLGADFDAMTENERDDSAAAIAMGGKMTLTQARRFVADALEAYRSHVADLRDEADDAARAALEDAAATMPQPVALLRKLYELAEGAEDRKPYARAASAVVEGLAMTRDADGLHVASQSEHGKTHTVNHHGCNCKARGYCLHQALWAATVALDAEE